MSSENTAEELMLSAAFTGYRPQKLPFGNDLSHPDAVKLRAALHKEYEKLVLRGFRYFYTGGALGSDLMAAEVILELKRQYEHREIRHKLCLPCLNHCAKWRREDIVRLEKIKMDSDVVYVSHRPYFSGCMQLRNQYMVDASAVLIAVYDGQSGGTKNTVDYARGQGRKIIEIRPKGFLRVEFFEKPEDTEQLMLLDDE